ncbi:MAG: retropepsin-like aspartic protease [Thermoproteota archaeon]
MRILGYINYGYRPPAPFLIAVIVLHELNVEARLPLLLDTGASNTVVPWGDIKRIGIDVSSLKPERKFSGLGGLVEAKPITSTINFRSEKGELVEEKAKVYVVTSACVHPKLDLLPSILGRDIINKYALNYNYENGEVYLEK